MGKSYQDYDKITVGDKILSVLKVFGLGLAGAVLGSIIPVFLLCVFNVASAPLYLLSGCGAMIFYGVYVKKEGRRIYHHPLLILSALLGTFAAQLVAYMIHYAPRWSPVFEYGPFEKMLRAYFIDPQIDYFSGGHIVTDGGTLSVYTFYVISAVCAIIGIYVAFLFVLASDDEDKKKSKKKQK